MWKRCSGPPSEASAAGCCRYPSVTAACSPPGNAPAQNKAAPQRGAALSLTSPASQDRAHGVQNGIHLLRQGSGNTDAQQIPATPGGHQMIQVPHNPEGNAAGLVHLYFFLKNPVQNCTSRFFRQNIGIFPSIRVKIGSRYPARTHNENRLS